jgi:hypothetical protein
MYHGAPEARIYNRLKAQKVGKVTEKVGENSSKNLTDFTFSSLRDTQRNPCPLEW